MAVATMQAGITEWTVQESASASVSGGGDLSIMLGGHFHVLTNANAIEFALAILTAAGYAGSWPPAKAPTPRTVTSYSRCATQGGSKAKPRGSKGK